MSAVQSYAGLRTCNEDYLFAGRHGDVAKENSSS